jgi:hypothetical protein
VRVDPGLRDAGARTGARQRSVTTGATTNPAGEVRR